jgi:hypothetical protein
MSKTLQQLYDFVGTEPDIRALINETVKYLKEQWPPDGSSIQTVYSRKTTLTDAQFKALVSTPIQLISAPGAGKMVFPIAYFLVSNDCDFHGRQASIDRCTIDVYGGFQVNAGIGGSANMTQTYIGNSGYVDLYTSKQVSGCYLNGFAFLTANNNISNCQVGQSGGIDANGFTVSSSSVAAHVTFIANEATSNKVIDAVKKYRAYITQSGTDAPIVINEFENTLGGTPVFGYGGVGYYTVALTGAFPSGKTDVRISYDLGASVGGLVAGAGRLDNDTVQLFNYLGDYSNVNSFAGSIEILVNP